MRTGVSWPHTQSLIIRERKFIIKVTIKEVIRKQAVITHALWGKNTKVCFMLVDFIVCCGRK